MKKKKKTNKALKKVLTLFVLLLVLGGLFAGFFILKDLNAEVDEDSDEDTSFEIFDKGSAIVTKVSFKTKDENLSFSYVNEDWVYDGDSKFPLDQDGVASMAAAIGKISATVKVEDPSEDLSDYGLKDAALVVNATFSDDSERSFFFGDVNKFNNCQYFMLTGDDGIYMIESDVATAFGVDLDYLYEPELYVLQKESITDDEVTSITITTAGGQQKVISDTEGISKLYELVYTLDLSKYEDYYADESEMFYDYGISPEGERITVGYTVESTENGKTVKVPKEYTVYIGYKYEDAEESSASSSDTTAAEDKKTHAYFYSFEGSDVVYTADGETVDDIFGFLAYEPKETETTATK
ncbi:MAG: DUF4340 domain-containing protein [Clostridia bacterium]|nr:DUF4340 domain-containing protein [Clostridia bacterium]